VLFYGQNYMPLHQDVPEQFRLLMVLPVQPCALVYWYEHCPEVLAMHPHPLKQHVKCMFVRSYVAVAEHPLRVWPCNRIAAVTGMVAPLPQHCQNGCSNTTSTSEKSPIFSSTITSKQQGAKS
jgi:hypothetical protein